MNSSNRKENPDRWNDRQTKEWFDRKEWLQGWHIVPHASVHKTLMARYFFQNPDRWTKAFNLLHTCRFGDLLPGRQELDGENLFFSVSHYVTRDPATVKFESHRRYADIQYVFEGEEHIGVAGSSGATGAIPYDPAGDIAFFHVTGAHYHLAAPSSFLVFFPGELHQPGVWIRESLPVKKIVVKVMID